MTPDVCQLYSEEGEQAVLCAVLCEPDVLPVVSAIVSAESFFRPAHATLFRAMCRLVESDTALDPLTLKTSLDDRRELESIGGSEYIAYLIDVAPSAANVQHHAEIVRGLADRRKMISAAQKLIEGANDRRIPVGALAQAAASAILPVATPSRRAYRLLDLAEMRSLPAPRWIVDRAIPEAGTVALVGPTKQYKTFVAIDLCARVSLGLEWQGRQTCHGTVVFIAGEGASGIRQRLEAWSKYWGAEPDILVLPHSINFGTATNVAQLVSAIRTRIPDGRVALVVIDTLNRNMSGDENSSEYVAQFMASCDAVRDATGATIMVVHHAGHSANGEDGAKLRPRGSSAFAAAMDTVLLCSQENGGDRVRLTCDKQKDGIDGWSTEFKVEQFAHSLILKPSGGAVEELTGQRLQSLLVLHREFGKDGAASGEWEEATGIDASSSFQKARKWLLDRRYVHRIAKRYAVTEAGVIALTANGSGAISTISTAPPPHLH